MDRAKRAAAVGLSKNDKTTKMGIEVGKEVINSYGKQVVMTSKEAIAEIVAYGKT